MRKEERRGATEAFDAGPGGAPQVTAAATRRRAATFVACSRVALRKPEMPPASAARSEPAALRQTDGSRVQAGARRQRHGVADDSAKTPRSLYHKLKGKANGIEGYAEVSSKVHCDGAISVSV
jgi:hypothetical protein